MASNAGSTNTPPSPPNAAPPAPTPAESAPQEQDASRTATKGEETEVTPHLPPSQPPPSSATTTTPPAAVSQPVTNVNTVPIQQKPQSQSTHSASLPPTAPVNVASPPSPISSMSTTSEKEKKPTQVTPAVPPPQSQASTPLVQPPSTPSAHAQPTNASTPSQPLPGQGHFQLHSPHHAPPPFNQPPSAFPSGLPPPLQSPPQAPAQSQPLRSPQAQGQAQAQQQQAQPPSPLQSQRPPQSPQPQPQSSPSQPRQAQSTPTQAKPQPQQPMAQQVPLTHSPHIPHTPPPQHQPGQLPRHSPPPSQLSHPQSPQLQHQLPPSVQGLQSPPHHSPHMMHPSHSPHQSHLPPHQLPHHQLPPLSHHALAQSPSQQQGPQPPHLQSQSPPPQGASQPQAQSQSQAQPQSQQSQANLPPSQAQSQGGGQQQQSQLPPHQLHQQLHPPLIQPGHSLMQPQHIPMHHMGMQSHLGHHQPLPHQQPPAHLSHMQSHPSQLHAQQGPIQPTPQGGAPSSAPSAAGPSPIPAIPPTLPAAPIQPIQTIQASPIPGQMQHQQGQGSAQQQVPREQFPPMGREREMPRDIREREMQPREMPREMPRDMREMPREVPPPLPSPSSQNAPRANPPSPYNPPAPQQQRQIKFENALEFLDQVKLQFQKHPRVYNQFLDIMKDFKAQYIDTPGVIARVSDLFKGHKHLILGFNTFLPPGYKIEIPDDDKPPVLSMPPQHQQQQQQQQQQPPPHPPPIPVQQAPPQPVPPAAQPPLRKQPEFDHARSYVKKIKTRFQLQPTVYKSFLDILHAYHKEQHTIKDVYDQVATLFANHADLLEEFTQFLPDPVASGNAPALPPPTSPTVQAPTTGPRATKGTRGVRAPQKGKLTAPPSPEREREKEKATPADRRSTKRGPARRSDEGAPSKRTAHEREVKDEFYREKGYGQPSPPATPVATPKEEEMEGTGKGEKVEGTFEELDFFNRVKSALGNPKLYHEFLKCLNLYSQEIISRVELVLLVKDLLSRYPDLFDWFKHFIGFDEQAMELLEKKEAMAMEDNRQPWSEIDYSMCKRYGPSYRALPANYANLRCSGRTDLCWSVLNDTWVSVPTGSEDFTFKNQRKNQYEEVLFKCEDERYELDLVIELNTSAIRALEPIKNKLVGLTEEEAATFKMEALDPLHARSIERIYGDKGAEILEGIYSNPAVAVPIVLNRLKQKDFEWHKSKQDWDKVWREITAKNYYKSLDHQSFYFKQAEKKTLNPKVLFAEIKQQYSERLREQQEDGKEKRKDKNATPWHLQYMFTDPQVFQDIADLITFSADKMLHRSDKEKIDTFLKHFLQVFFRIEEIYTHATLPPALSPVAAPGTPPATTSQPQQDKSAEKQEKEKEKEKGSAPTTPPTPNLNTTEPKPEAEKKDVAMEDAPAPEEAASSTPAPTTNGHANGAEDPNANKPEGEKEKEEGEKEKEKEVERVRRIRKIFFGNNSFYVFFRLFQIMYDRLLKGKELAQAARNSKWSTRPARIPRPNGESLDQAPQEGENGVKTPAEAPKEKEKEKKEDKEKDRYQTALEKLYSLLAGAIDQPHFEDECRSLLGISSYVLFTMDKLVVQTTRQLQALLSSETCAKLLSLFMYETVRPQGMLESVYHASCAELLREERMFLFEFEQTPCPGRFTLQLLDSSTQPVPRFMEFNFEPSKYSEYVASFQRDSSHIDPQKHHVFLLRSQRQTRDNPEILKGVLSVNNLECRICLSTYRLFYVEDTEDFFYRPPASRLTKNKNRDLTKFRKLDYAKLGVAPPSAEDVIMKS